MAEFALGLTKTAVAGTVSRVKLAIEEEAKLRVRVQDDLVFITGEFEMMQSFLSASSAGERASKNQVVRTWVRQLRELAFDVEDCVEFVVHLDKASRWDWVRRLASSVLVCMARPPLPLDTAVEEIKRLKARVEDVSQRNTRYNLIGDGDDLPAEHQVLMRHAAGRTSAATSTFHALREVWKSKGKLSKISPDLKRLINCQGSYLQVISLWGSPEDNDNDVCEDDVVVEEVRWVTTMRKAYCDPEICREFRNRAWVKTLAHPFNPVEFISNLLTQFKSHHNNFDDGHTNHRLSELMRQLSQHRYLIIIEQELTTIADWDAIRMYLPDNNNGSRIVVSTNYLGIALACTREAYDVFELTSLSNRRSLYAFSPKRRCVGMGVNSVLCKDNDEYLELMAQLYKYENLRVLDGVEYEHSYLYDAEAKGCNLQLNLADFVVGLLRRYYLDKEEVEEEEEEEEVPLNTNIIRLSKKDDIEEKLMKMSSQEKIEKCRKILTKQNWLVFINNLKSSTEWDLVKRDLLPAECTRGCIVVTTREQIVAAHCVDHDGYRVLNVTDLMKGFDEQDDDEDEESSITEDDKYEPAGLVGRDKDVWFVNEDYSVPARTLCLWGIASVGKTALARAICEQVGCQYNRQGWVDVPYPFNLTDLCRRLLLDFYSNDADAKESVLIGIMEGQDPIQWCCKFLLENESLLVIDGVRSTHDWDMIRATLLSKPFYGTTVVITREESIATYCTDTKECILNVKGLQDDEALELFTKIALKGKILSKLHPKTKIIAKHLMSKCGGLPEVIVAIAKFAHAKSNPRDPLEIHVLKHLNANFMGTLETSSDFHCLRGLFCWMKSYFDACSDELKPCIFYMSVFPANLSIRRRRLLRRWIAEGYSSSGGSGAALEEKGERLLLELLKLSILYKEKQTSTVKSCKVNGFFCQYIKSRPMEDNLVFALEGSCSPSSRLSGQHLTISRSWDRDANVFNSIDLSRLRSLTVFGVWESFLISEKMRFLRVLDLEGTNTLGGTSITDDHLEEISKVLLRLKFLSLRGCRQIAHLPDSLGDMRQLQTLDVRYTSIVELPSLVITKLRKLQYIRAGTSTDTSLLLLQTPPPPTGTPPPPPSTAAAPPPPPSSTSTTPPPAPSTQPPLEDNHVGTSSSLQTTPVACVDQGALLGTSVRWKRRARDLVESSGNIWWQFKNRQDLNRRRRVAANGGGVEVGHAAGEGVGRLTDLHTLGVVNVAGGKGAFLFLKELKRLTQLRKLGLSGINRENWLKLCDAITCNLHHLESLSLQLMLLEEGGNYEFACFDNIDKPPKTIKRLKVLYTSTGGRDVGGACIGPFWLEKLPNLERFDHEVTISTQEDMRRLFSTVAELPKEITGRVRVKPIQQQHLSFEESGYHVIGIRLKALMIDCSSSSNSTVTFGDSIPVYVKVLRIHCASSSCLRISGLQHIRDLKQVRVTGSCSQDLKEDLLKQLNDHPGKPVPKLVTSST